MTDNQTQLDTNDCWCKCGAVYRSEWLAVTTVSFCDKAQTLIQTMERCPKCNEQDGVIRARQGGKVLVL